MKTNAFEVVEFPKTRLATMDVGRFALKKHYMFCLLEADVTKARTRFFWGGEALSNSTTSTLRFQSSGLSEVLECRCHCS